jgi:hypothetical protein
MSSSSYGECSEHDEYTLKGLFDDVEAEGMSRLANERGNARYSGSAVDLQGLTSATSEQAGFRLRWGRRFRLPEACKIKDAAETASLTLRVTARDLGKLFQ